MPNVLSIFWDFFFLIYVYISCISFHRSSNLLLAPWKIPLRIYTVNVYSPKGNNRTRYTWLLNLITDKCWLQLYFILGNRRSSARYFK